MGKYETSEMLFKSFGNRRGLTDLQIYSCDAIAQFFKAFNKCFERDYYRMVWLLIEPEGDIIASPPLLKPT